MSGTICDALMTSTPGVLTWEINRKLVGEGVSASDAEVGRAVAFAFRRAEAGGRARRRIGSRRCSPASSISRARWWWRCCPAATSTPNCFIG